MISDDLLDEEGNVIMNEETKIEYFPFSNLFFFPY